MVFELQAEQIKLEAALRETEEAAARAEGIAKQREVAAMQRLDLEQWKELEKKEKKELNAHRKLLTETIEAVAKGDVSMKSALEKAMLRPD